MEKNNNITSAKINDNLLNDRVNSILNSKNYTPKPGMHKIIVSKGDNFTKLLLNSAVNIREIQNIIHAISEEIDLRKLRPEDVIELYYEVNVEGIFLDKINLTMAGKKIIVKKDSFQVFRISEESKNNIDDVDLNEKQDKTFNEDIILGQLREIGWSKKEAREGLDALSTVYDPKKITKNTEIILPKDKRVRAFSIKIINDFMILVQKNKNGDFLAQKLNSKKAITIITSLKHTEKIKLKKERESKQNFANERNTEEDSVQTDELYYKTNLIEGKIVKGDTLISRLLALGEKKDTIMKALNSLSKRMNPNLVRSGSSLIVALDRKSKPMRGFFITEKKNKGYLVILDNDRYTVQSSSMSDAKIELAKLVKPNLSQRKKNIKKTPIWKTTSLVIPYKNNVKLFTFKREILYLVLFK